MAVVEDMDNRHFIPWYYMERGRKNLNKYVEKRYQMQLLPYKFTEWFDEYENEGSREKSKKEHRRCSEGSWWQLDVYFFFYLSTIFIVHIMMQYIFWEVNLLII